MADQQLPATFWQQVRRIAAEEARKSTLGIFRSASVTEGDFTIKGGGSIIVGDGGGVRSSDFDGDLDARDPGTVGWAIDKAAAAFPDLLLRPGSIGNDALANPIRGDAALSSTSGFALNTTGTVPLVSQSWFVPEGFTKAHIYITGRVFAINSTAGVDYLYARSRIYLPSSGITGFGNGIPIAASGSNGSALNVSPLGWEIVNLGDGDEVRLEVQGWTEFANWAANAANAADVAGQITWTR